MKTVHLWLSWRLFTGGSDGDCSQVALMEIQCEKVALLDTVHRRLCWRDNQKLLITSCKYYIRVQLALRLH